MNELPFLAGSYIASTDSENLQAIQSRIYLLVQAENEELARWNANVIAENREALRHLARNLYPWPREVVQIDYESIVKFSRNGKIWTHEP